MEPGEYHQLNQAFKSSHWDFFHDTPGRNRMMDAKWFITEVETGNMVAVQAMMRKDPTLLNRIGFVSSSYAGAYGMAVWKHLCNNIVPTDPNMRRMTYIIADAVQPDSLKATYFLQFGFRGKWKEHVQAAIKFGVEVPEDLVKDVDDILSN